MLPGAINCFDDGLRSQVVNHVTQTGKSDEFALRQLSVQPRGLALYIRDLIVRTRDDRHWHRYATVVSLQFHG